MIENAAVFIGSQRRFKGVNVEFDESTVVIKDRVKGAELARYSVVEVAKEGMAWDVAEEGQEPGGRLRLVAQQGCGCSGMKPYKNDASYTGPFTRR